MMNEELIKRWKKILRAAAFEVDGYSNPDDRSAETDELCDLALLGLKQRDLTSSAGEG